MAMKCIPKLPASDQFNFVKEEEKILEYWSKNRVFEIQSIREQEKVYSFYDGPPFATGLPHYGHILAGTVKDVVTRYAFQTGHSVERRFGWDCHGLPIEFEMDKLLNIKSPQDVHKMGIDKYNAECRNIVTRYTNEWRTIVERLGRWIDFDNDYKTMNTNFMESVWWVFKQLFMKGFVYQGFKVMPYSAACTTPLSNFEATQNYKDVVDPSLFVLFELKDRPQVFMLSWTTTPWTLPSNLALCVNADFDYVEIIEKATNRIFIMAENRLSFAFAQFSDSDYEIVNKYRGSQLKSIEYKPLFEYFSKGGTRVFRILCDNYVTADAGTGVVHQAPYFGEQDYRVCIENGVIAKDEEPVCPLDEKCCFTSEVSDWQGMNIKDADPKIIAALKLRKMIFKSSQIKHSYPFCWRSDTPLVYRAVNSWFIRASQMIEKLLKTNESTYWVPDFVKEKRFGNWLRDAHDWAVSRNRFWGTPIPIWISDDGVEVVCVGSRKELCDLIGKQIDLNDIHREFIDKIEIPSKRPNKGTLKRVPEVFDCWFESGSMPFAQNHYPFENKQHFESTFPADFISEGIDQTRGWFYTLLVISTAIYHKAPFKNLIASGLVLASDGQKMSKRKKNYPNPMDVINSHGSDALRLYLISSPVVRAENLRFNQNGVRAIVNDVFRPWYNSFRFLFQNIEIFVHDFNENYCFDDNSISAKNIQSFNVMDRWILSFMQSLIRYVDSEMKSYRLYNVLPKLISFVDKLTNWYIRLNRQRSKGVFGKEDCIQSLLTLNKVLNDLSKLMSPITPFITEYMHSKLTVLNGRQSQVTSNKVNSVHLERIPVARADLIDTVIERSVLRMQTIVELGRVIRDAKQISMKFPLNRIVVIHKDDEYLNDVESLKQFLLVELNCREIVLSHDYRQYKVKVKAEPNYNTLGEKLKSDLKIVKRDMLKLSSEEVEASIDRGYFDVGQYRIDKSDSRVTFYMDDDAKRSNPGLESNSDGDVLILLDMQMTRFMIDEGMSREITNRVQKLRKKAGLVPLDQVYVHFHTRSVELLSVIEQFRDFIETQIKSPFMLVENSIDLERLSPKIIEEKFDMKNSLFEMKNDRFLTLVLLRAEDHQSST